MKFWMVYVEGMRGPEYRHPSLLSASTEASRLARIQPGKKAVVLEAIGHHVTNDTVWQPYEPLGEPPNLDEEMPF